MNGTAQPELYTEAQLNKLEAHISRYFGSYANVFHEIVSPDIHVDIAVIDPTPERNYYTLVTMGMGAHRMNVPQELRAERLERAEMMICLPPDWELQNQDERWYWPLRWLKIMARLPGEHDTWLGWGHTVPAGGPFDESTDLCGMLLAGPGAFPEESHECMLEEGDAVNFYQMIPLYEDEMDYKIRHRAEKLLERIPGEYLEVVRINRPSFADESSAPRKQFALSREQIEDLLEWEGADGCLATDRIVVDGCPVGYLYREEQQPGMDDSGWRFLAGDETDAYLEDADNSGVYRLNTICNYDRDIIPLLASPCGSAFIRDDSGSFQRVQNEK